MLALVGLTAALMLGQEGQALLQSCVLEESGWVCRYRVPEGVQPSKPAVIRPIIEGQKPSVEPAAPDEAPAALEAEKVRQERLIRRCADASWLSFCSPDDRREAKALKAAAEAAAKLKLEVTTLASEGRCPEAIRVALQAGDLELARNIREFCAPAK